MNENAVEFKVLFWVADISKTGELKSKILSEIYQTVSKEGIQLPSSPKDFYLHFPEGIAVTSSGEKANEKKHAGVETSNAIKKTPPAKD